MTTCWSFSWLTENMADAGLPALMAIAGEGGIAAWFLGEMLRDRRLGSGGRCLLVYSMFVPQPKAYLSHANHKDSLAEAGEDMKPEETGDE